MNRNHLLGAAVGVLCVFIGLNLTNTLARGQSSAFRVLGVGIVAVGSQAYYLDGSNLPYGWKSIPGGPFTLPPVDVSSLVSYDGFWALTDTGEGWGKVAGVWTDLGPIPSVATVRTTWGQVKDKYRR